MREEFERRRALIQPGAWVADCCQVDLHQLETEADALDLRDHFTELEACNETAFAPAVFATEAEARSKLGRCGD